MFKGTDCGAFIEPLEGDGGEGVAVGSIVEGSDAQTETHKLRYPFAARALSDALDLIEEEAREIWEAEHGEDVPDDHPGFDASFLTY